MVSALTKRVPTLFLKAVLALIGTGVLAIAVFAFPNIWLGAVREWPQLTNVLYPALIGIYATVIPFFFALFQAFVLLRNIDKERAFSESSVSALRLIAYSAVAISALYACAMPLAFTVAQLDDAPGLVLISFGIVCAPLIVATFAAVLQALVRSAVAMKAEQDLTV